jgi:nitric oxide reductase large subunit
MIQATGFTGFGPGFTDSDNLLDPATRLTELITSIISTITIFAGLAFVFWFVIGAITWITGGHDSSQLDKAKSQMSTAVIGLVFTALVIPITWLIGKLTGIDIINPETIINTLSPNFPTTSP